MLAVGDMRYAHPAAIPALMALAFVAGIAASRLAMPQPVLATAPAIGEVPPPAGATGAIGFSSARYPARVLRIIDGDTVEARIAIWLGQEIVTKVRLRGIDAPEIIGACPSESTRAQAARRRLDELVAGGPVMLEEIGPDKYHGRVVARLRNAAGIDTGAALVADGHAKPWTGRRHSGWCALERG